MNCFLDDGAYLVAKLLVQAARMNRQGKTLGSLIVNLPRPLEAQEFRLKIKTEYFGTYGKQVLKKVGEMVENEPGWSPEQPNYEGMRVQCAGEGEDGWLLLYFASIAMGSAMSCITKHNNIRYFYLLQG